MKTTRNSPRARAERTVVKRFLRLLRSSERHLRCGFTLAPSLSGLCCEYSALYYRLGTLEDAGWVSKKAYQCLEKAP